MIQIPDFVGKIGLCIFFFLQIGLVISFIRKLMCLIQHAQTKIEEIRTNFTKTRIFL